MPGRSTATIDILKSLTNVSFSCLSAIFGAAGNVPLAGITAFPPAALAAYETLRENIRAGKQKDRPLRVPLPSSSQWSGSPEEWQMLCCMCEQRLPDILEHMHRHLEQIQGFLSQEQIRQAFIGALVAEPLPVLADTPAKRRQVGEIIATPVLAHLAHILAPVILTLNQEHAWADTNASRNALEALKNRFAPPPLSRQELTRLSKRYRTALHRQWKMLDFRGISHIDVNRPLSIPLGDIFILPDVLVGVPASETFERDTAREKDPSDARPGKDEDHRFEREPAERRQRYSTRTSTILQRTALSPILARQNRLVILGDPGSGKSTLLRYLLLQLTEAHPQILQTQPALAKALSRLHPVYIPLATYAADWASQSVGERSLLDFLPRYLQDQMLGDYGETILFHLSQGTLLFLLDGLDEIPDTSLRVQIVKAIETLTLSFPKNRFIVTSRIVGYKDAPLAAGYEPYTLADFTREQIRIFADKWTPAYERWVKQASTDQSPEATAREAEKLFQATQRNAGVRRLALNPLLLTILALIQRQGIELPSHRVDLYDRCATTLLDTWITAKGKQLPADFDKNKLFKILCPLAFWMHEHPSVGAVPGEELLAQIADRLLHRQVVRTQEEAADFAEAFLQTVRSQTGILVERGKERYGFLHLTFEEYFAARELVLRDDRDVFIKTHLHNPRWREVILLAAGTIGILQGDEKGVTRLLQEAVLGAQSPFENRLHRDLILAGICLADDIGVSVACEEEIMERIVSLFLLTPYQTLCESMTAVFQAWRDTPLARRCIDLFAPLFQKHILSFPNTMLQTTPAPLSGTQLQTKVEEYSSQHQQWSREARTHLVQIALLALLPETKVQPDHLLEMVDQARCSPDWRVRQAAASALGQLGSADPRVPDTLLASLSDSDWRVRQAAASALGQLGSTDPRVPDALLASLSDSFGVVRQAAASALGQLDGEQTQAISALTRLLTDYAPNIQRTAIATLLKFPEAHFHETMLFIESMLQRYDRQTDRQIEADAYVDTLLFILQQLAGEA